MASAINIYGQIGAAKAFNSSVAYSLDLYTKYNEDEISQLKEQLLVEKDVNERKHIKRRIKRLERRNKMNNVQSKVANGVTDFLTKICSYMDIGIAVIIKWIANLIVTVLPALEISVKMLLLTNIKKMVSCAMDPRIPSEWRDPGVLINEAMIDPRDILKSSPYSKWGKYNYFGAFYDKERTEPRPKFELARAEDMNAFLWFAKNCTRFVSPNILGNDLSVYFDNASSGTTLFNTHVFKGKNEYRYTEGSTFKHDNDSNTTFLCEKREFRTDGTYYTIVPATDRWTGINWYKDRTSITGTERSGDINYDKSKPLFNIEYLGEPEPLAMYPDGNFRFRILPKPFSTAGGFVVDLVNNINTMADMVDSHVQEVVGSEITSMPEYKFQGIQSPIPYTARFNEKGAYDKKGRYSINTLRYVVVEDVSTNVQGKVYFDIFDALTYSEAVAHLLFNKGNKTFSLVSDKTNDTPITDIVVISSILTECYAGNTVYEFNYDYVVSMKLFDAKEIATGIVDALMNINLPNPFRRSNGSDEASVTNTDQVRIDAYVDKLVEKLIDTEEKEFTDCFYTFSNEDYESMEQEVADKVANSTLITDKGTDSIQEIYSIIDSYDADATLNEKVETISLALTKAANACGFTDLGDDSGNTNSSKGSYATSVGDNASILTFITQAVQFLTSAIVNAILTPKVLMLLQVNRMMMGTYAMPTKPGDLKENYEYNIEDILNGLSGLLKGIIREIVNTIQKELLRLILEKLSEMMAAYLKRLGLEYAMKWITLLKQLLSCFKMNRNGMGDRLNRNQYADAINNIIDQVDYADIDTLVDEIMPNTNPC